MPTSYDERFMLPGLPGSPTFVTVLGPNVEKAASLRMQAASMGTRCALSANCGWLEWPPSMETHGVSRESEPDLIPLPQFSKLDPEMQFTMWITHG